MLPGRERLHEIATTPQGSLSEVPYGVLLAALALEKREVLAVLSRRQTEKHIVFSNGAPVDCRSNMLHETFGRFLVGQKRISEQEFDLAFAHAKTRRVRLDEALAERGDHSSAEV